MSVVRFGKKASSHIAVWVEISEASWWGFPFREAFLFLFLLTMWFRLHCCLKALSRERVSCKSAAT